MSRRGTTLAELLVVLVVGVLVVGLCAQSVVAQRRAERTTAAANAPGVVVDDASRVLTSALARVAAGDSLWLRGDTALEWRATIGVALSCAAGGDTIVVPDSGLGAWWEAPADSADAAEVRLPDGTIERHEIIAQRARSAGGACGAAQHTLVVRDVIAAIGTAAVRVSRRTRFMVYRGGDGDWWLGQRTCSFGAPIRCAAAQPITGPLAGARTGLQFAVDTTGGVARVSVRVQAGRFVRTALAVIPP